MFDSLLTNLFGEDGDYARYEDEPDTTKETDRGDINEGGMGSYAFSGMQGWRNSMEDAHLACYSIPVHTQQPLSKGHAIFGVMDGHGGAFTSGFAADNFLGIFSLNPRLKQYATLSPDDQSDVPGIALLRSALRETYSALDREIRKKQNQKNDIMREMAEESENAEDYLKLKSRLERSGSTCIVVMVTPSHIICANAGDSRAILQRNGKTLPLSFDHKPNNIPELQRINNTGGFVRNRRVNGDLAVSRALGDFSYKRMDHLSTNKQQVIAEPEFVIYPRDFEKDEFMVLACDGVWDVATNEECAMFVQRYMNGGRTDLGSMCEDALDKCLAKESRDNMTIGLVTFDGAQYGIGLGGAKEAASRAMAKIAMGNPEPVTVGDGSTRR